MATYSPSDYELLRRRCAQLKDQGWKQATIAQAMILTEGWVRRALKKYQQEGQVALAWRKSNGPACCLTDEQLAHLVTELNKVAESYGFPSHVWARPRVNEVIQKLFEVSYDPSQVGRLLQKVGWTREKPQAKARQQNLERVEQWRNERLYRIIQFPKNYSEATKLVFF